MGQNRLKIGISGSYGGCNLGDEAILQSIVTCIRHSYKDESPEITVFSRNPEDTMKRHKNVVDRSIPVRDFTPNEIMPELKRLDLFVLGGGGILFEGEARNFLREVEIANQLDVPVMVYAIGTGPLEDLSLQKYVRKTLSRAEVITVREKSGQKFLEELGINKEVIVTADPAFLLSAEEVSREDLLSEGFKETGNLVAISVREPGQAAPDLDEDVYLSLIADAADFIVDRFEADVVFIPMEPKDIQHSHGVISRMLQAKEARVLKGDYTSGQVMDIMTRFSFAVGMRLHFLIFAALQGIPFVALPYASKVRGLLNDLEIKMPPLRLVNAGRVAAYIDRFWDEKEEIKNKISQKLPGLKKRALQNNQLLKDLIKRLQEEKNK